jgi:hypothetical protein
VNELVASRRYFDFSSVMVESCVLRKAVCRVRVECARRNAMTPEGWMRFDYTMVSVDTLVDVGHRAYERRRWYRFPSGPRLRAFIGAAH